MDRNQSAPAIIAKVSQAIATVEEVELLEHLFWEPTTSDRLDLFPGPPHRAVAKHESLSLELVRVLDHLRDVRVAVATAAFDVVEPLVPDRDLVNEDLGLSSQLVVEQELDLGVTRDRQHRRHTGCGDLDPLPTETAQLTPLNALVLGLELLGVLHDHVTHGGPTVNRRQHLDAVLLAERDRVAGLDPDDFDEVLGTPIAEEATASEDHRSGQFPNLLGDVDDHLLALSRHRPAPHNVGERHDVVGMAVRDEVVLYVCTQGVARVKNRSHFGAVDRSLPPSLREPFEGHACYS